MILQIDTTFETYDKFFNLNIDVKKKYAKRTGTTLKNGWVELERERYSYSNYIDTSTEENSFKLNLLQWGVDKVQTQMSGIHLYICLETRLLGQ